ncbi:MAG: S9 family peptidase [Alphaproteobacteria bacterium]|nr:S9 family peptidase [Alphaproteobacteria bacterium]
MKHQLAIAAAALLASHPVLAEDTPTNTFQSEDVFDLEYAGNPAVSPDGRSVIYERRSNDIMTDRTRTNLWMVDLDSGAHVPLMSGRKSYSTPVWSPEGDRIAFLSNEEGSTQLYVHWLESGRTALVSNLEKSPRDIVWAPDGTSLAFTMKVPADHKPLKVKSPKKPAGAKWAEKVTYVSKARYQRDGQGIIDPAFRHVFIIPADGGSARQLTSDDFNHRGPLAFSANGSEIFFSANRNDDWEYQARESDIFAVSLAGAIRQITDTPGREENPTLSPDGKRLAYLASDNQPLAYRNQELMVMRFGDDQAESLTKPLDRSVDHMVWDNRSRGLYFQYENRGTNDVRHVDLDGNMRDVITGLSGTTLGRPYTSGSFDFKGGTVAFTQGNAQRPADLFAIRHNKTRKLTNLNEEVLGHKTMADLHELSYKSSIDGEEIQGWYLTPPGFDPTKKYPLILEIHGGPHAAYGPNFSAEMQRYAAEGYVVFYDNHRGSTGYGERFALLLQNKYASEYDFADHNSGVDAMIGLGFIDADQLYITGGSAGGIASAYAIGLTDRFRAAAVAKPVINWISKVLTADSYLYQVPNQFPGMPWDNVEHYWKRSPLSLVGNVKTPTLLITGEADRRTPISETEQFYQALKLRRVDTLMVRVPGSPHGIAGRPSRLIAKVENILAWFEKYK